MRYTHIVFDIDGTLLDTESAVLTSLQEMVLEVQKKELSLFNLRFALGIPGDVTLQQLGIEDKEKAYEIWDRNFKKYHHTIKLFDGIETLIKELKTKGYKLGIITSKNRAEYAADFVPHGIAGYFDTVICVEDSARPKPSPDPMLEYLKRTGAKPEETLYIGDTAYDMQCADGAGVDFGLALWGGSPVKHIYAAHYFNRPYDVSYMLTKRTDAFDEMPWLKWAMELQFISQAGLTYSENNFDLERFERLREISAEMMSHSTGFPKEHVKDVFCNETGFQTPKLDTRAAIFKDGKILLVKENNGTWSLPGGWVDVNESVRSNTIKETKEESGLDVIPVKLIAVEDRNQHNLPLYAYGVCKIFALCEIVGGDFSANIETQKSEFFSLDELPLLAEEKNNREQIKMCFDAYNSKDWEVLFD